VARNTRNLRRTPFQNSAQTLKGRATLGQIVRLPVILLVFLIAGAVLTGCTDRTARESRAAGKLTLALPVADWWTAAPFIVSQKAPFKERGLELATLEVNSGLASKNAVVAGTADIGISAAAPLALAAASGEELVILGTYLHSPTVIGIVRPSEEVVGSVPSEPIAVVPSTISEFALYHYLARIGKQHLLEQGQIRQLQLKPPDIPTALRNGSAKSAVIWEPFLSLSEEQPRLKADRTELKYDVSLYIITRPSILANRPEAVRAFLEGIDIACRRLNEKPEESRLQVERHFGFSKNFLSPTWSSVEYRYLFSKDSLRSEISRDAEIAKKLGYIKAVPSIDYLLPQNPPLLQN